MSALGLTGIRRARVLNLTPYVAPPPGLTESFTGTDGVSLNGRAADTGQTWTVTSGSASIAGNRAKVAAYNPTTALIESGLADATWQMTIDFSTGGTRGLIFRGVDANNYWRVATSGPSSNLFLFKRVAGTETNVNQIVCTASTSKTLKVVTAGTSITVFDGATQLLTATDSALATATKAGLYTESFFGNDSYFDSLSVA